MASVHTFQPAVTTMGYYSVLYGFEVAVFEAALVIVV